jgi:acyl dehydratase
MIIDPAEVVGTVISEVPVRWTPHDVMLYQIGVGAGDPPTDERELRFSYERDLRVLPSFSTALGYRAGPNFRTVQGLHADQAVVLHGQQRIELGGPIPVEAQVSYRNRVANVYDKGSGALVVLESEATDAATGRFLFRGLSGLFFKGEGFGGYGGDRGPSERIEPPRRSPDVEGSYRTLPQQALLYRLCGDRNPLHVDPEVAHKAGFDRPILHGLCTFGMVCKKVIELVLDGDPASVRAYETRFAGHVFPGETIRLRVWREGNRVIVDAQTEERGTPVVVGALTIG